MNKSIGIFATAALMSTAAFMPPLSAAEAGRVLFASGDVRIIAPDGSSRAAKRGDIVQDGERMQTANGALGQVRMIDGERVGVRGDSKVLFSPPSANTAQPRRIEIESGRVRVLNVAARGKPEMKPVEVKTPDGELLMNSADVVVGVVLGSAAGRPGSAAPGARKVQARINRGKVQARRGAQRLTMVAGQAAEFSQGTIARVESRLNNLAPPAPTRTQLRPSDTAQNQKLGRISTPQGPIVKPGSFSPPARSVATARLPGAALQTPIPVTTVPRLPLVQASQLAIVLSNTSPTFSLSPTSGAGAPTVRTLLSTTDVLRTGSLDTTRLSLSGDTTSPTLSSLSTLSRESTFSLATTTTTEPLKTTESTSETKIFIEPTRRLSGSTTTLTTTLKCTTSLLGQTFCTR